ncbi:Glutamate receptor, ionotropic kainate 3 [Papilio machaon]|uniref:Glutamate receptor, ionotropic kainate 3 n=1 Tax=Papilio machaon TaxID=76193 RepID=A0A0N1PH93_PAPMA|nr:Glutamate receptor, ionotropic kainate 3 [Papilio machaon]
MLGKKSRIGPWSPRQTEWLCVFIVENHELDLPAQIGVAMKVTEEAKPDFQLSDEIIQLDRENEEISYRKLCSALGKGATMIIDISWSPWEMLDQLSIPVLRTSLSSQQLVTALDNYLESRNATDAAILLESESDVDRTLYELLGRSHVRVWVHAELTTESAAMLRTMRPEPSFFAIIGEGRFVRDTYKRAVKEKLVLREYRWNLVITDYTGQNFDVSQLVHPAVILHLDAAECCKLQALDTCICPEDFPRKQYILNNLLQFVVDIFRKIPDTSPAIIRCDESGKSQNKSIDGFQELLATETYGNDTLFFWNADSEVEKKAIPWTMKKLDSTGEVMLDKEGRQLYEGYCIDLIEKLAQTMDFDYEIVIPKSGGFGQRLRNGSWDGLIGDLMTGLTAHRDLLYLCESMSLVTRSLQHETQIIILCTIRKPIRKTSLFKFMTVLRTEVWLSIVAALILTGVMIWLLEKYSPYSARNNPEAYPYPCREFTLKESFWFALTSFTPQGGGEAPKALSGRTLVAAYWLFVVLMLATFTANLAAFLTVERMQTPVSSLEQLARQSRINYTVVESSSVHQYFINMKFAEDTLYRYLRKCSLEQLARQSRINYTVVESSSVHQYFINMKFAEDTLYRVWKEITLNASSDQAQYRVWDYPIREQYGHILLAINASGPVVDAKTGFQKVNEHTEADFAFIHDSAEIKYEVTRNCNLTAVGEVFAEQPYALAVQQGSRLQEDLSRALLQLQKERFLEQLAAKYWNETARQMCPDADESEGITLESLGGVFIATLFGLGLAMITLAWEVFYYKRKEKNKTRQIEAAIDKKEAFAPKKIKKKSDNVARLRKVTNNSRNVTIGDKFKPVTGKGVSFINVLPKNDFRP